MRISDWSSDVCSSDLITSPWKWRHLKSVIVPSVQSPPSMLKLHDFCNRARAIATPDAEALADRLDAMMPRIRITELLHEVARETGFLAAFTNLRTGRSEEHTSELQSLMRISYAVFCLKKKNQ